MKVKIENRIYDSNDEPIMIIIDDEEKNLIKYMGAQDRICSYPDDDKYTPEIIKEFMKDIDDIYSEIKETDVLKTELKPAWSERCCSCKYYGIITQKCLQENSEYYKKIINNASRINCEEWRYKY